MIYSVNVRTTKQTANNNPTVTELFVTKGLVYKIEIHFPSGSAGLMGVIICDGGFQVWPSTLGEWFTGDGNTISFEDVYLKESAPYKFRILTYNIDTTYPHKVNIRIGLVSKDIFMARFLPHLSYKYFQRMIEDLQKQQQETKVKQQQAIIETPFPWLQGTIEE